VLPLNNECMEAAVKIHQQLKKKSKQIDLPDLLIAATAYQNKLPLATLNTKHFNRIDSLKLVARL